MDPIDQFAAEAIRFEAWACNFGFEGELAAREALIRIVSIYSAALQLPSPWTIELDDQPDNEGVSADENSYVVAPMSLPIDLYGMTSDPLIVPPEDAAIGSITDDVIDIYRDVVTGLRAYQSGQRALATWEWGFGFCIHWGYHATSAIQAIHAWMASYAVDHLTKTT